MIRSEQNYFTVFESSAAALGRITDRKLRENIISVYGDVKGLVDSLNTNSREFNIWRSFPVSNPPPEKQLVADMIEGLETRMRNGLDELHPSWTNYSRTS
ncbi:MAG TPA: hypothetical protein VFO40_26930 [Chthoniobacterales bacterium]|nr:hypothetical protein [Chthoniobacterales bacterium]